MHRLRASSDSRYGRLNFAGQARPLRSRVIPAPALAVCTAVAGCGGSSAPQHVTTMQVAKPQTPVTQRPAPAARHRGPLNVYAADAAGELSPVVRDDPALVYVP